jgi:glycosyltransferase involved in cell wall biosynthesis
MRVQLVDPSAFTPPYDHALAAALARAGADVELITSPFVYGPVPDADGYRVTASFYRRASSPGRSDLARRALKLAEHLPGMLRHRRLAREADVVHYQWLTLPSVDRHLLAPGRPRLLTAHAVMPADLGRRTGSRLRRLAASMDAVVVHSEQGARRLRQAGLEPDRLHVIPEGAFDYLTRIPAPSPLPDDLRGVVGPVILFFGLLRPYKGIDTLLRAFAGVRGAELWIVGAPRMPLGPLETLAEAAPGPVRFVPRFVTDAEIPAFMRRADIVVLPYRWGNGSGVLYAALAFGKALVLSSVGGFPEVAERHGAARIVPPDDPAALASVLNELVTSPSERQALGAAAARAALGPYSWDTVAERTLELYRRLLDRR